MDKYIFSFVDLWPYFLFFILFIFLSNFKLKRTNLLIFLCFLAFTCLRYDVGWDYIEYVALIESNTIEILESRFEPLSKIVFLVSSYINFFPLAFIFFSFTTLYLVYLFIKYYSNDKLLSWLVYYSMPLFFFASLSTIRQSIAMSVLLFSFRYLDQRRNCLFIFSIILASCFHISAVLGIFLFILYNYPLKKHFGIFLVLISFFFSAYLKSYIIDFESSNILLNRFILFYVGSEIPPPSILQYLYFFLVFITYLLYDKLVSINKNNIKFISFIYFGIIIYNILSFEPVSALRISAFFLIYWVVVIPDFIRIHSLSNQIILRNFVILFYLSMSFFYLFLNIDAYRTNNQSKISFLPYKTWLFR